METGLGAGFAFRFGVEQLEAMFLANQNLLAVVGDIEAIDGSTSVDSLRSFKEKRTSEASGNESRP